MNKKFFLFFLGLCPFILQAAELKSERYHLNLTGYKSFYFEYKNESGTVEGFDPGLYREENLEIEIEGRLERATQIRGALRDLPSQENLSYSELHLENPRFVIDLGRFETSMEDTPLLLDKSLVLGAQAEVQANAWRCTGLYSKESGPAQTDRFFYKGSGQYQLAHAPVLYQSETVFLKNTKLERNVDYRIDYLTGNLLLSQEFVVHAPEKGIEKEDRLVVSYQEESSGKTQSLAGASLSWKPDTLNGIAVSALLRGAPLLQKDSAMLLLGHSLFFGKPSIGTFRGQISGCRLPEDSLNRRIPLAYGANGTAKAKAVRAQVEAEHFDAMYPILGKAQRPASRNNYAAAGIDWLPSDRLNLKTRMAQDEFFIGDSAKALEQKMEGRISAEPLRRLRAEGFGERAVFHEENTAAEADSFENFGGKITKDWDHYSASGGLQRKHHHSLSERTTSLPADAILHTSRFSFLQTMTGVRYERAVREDSSQTTDFLQIHYTVSAHHHAHKLLASGAIETQQREKPAFENSVDASTQMAKVRIRANAQQKTFEEKMPVIFFPDTLEQILLRKTEIQQGALEVSSDHFVEFSASPAAKLCKTGGQPYLRDVTWRFSLLRDCFGRIKPGADLETNRFKQWNKNNYVPAPENTTSSDQLRLHLTCSRINTLALRGQWRAQRHEEESFPADSLSGHKQKGEDREWRAIADLALSDKWSALFTGTHETRAQSLLDGTASPDPMLFPTRLPDALIWRFMDSKTIGLDGKVIWQALAGLQWSALIGFSQRKDGRNADGSPASEMITTTWTPGTEITYSRNNLSAGASFEAPFSSGRYDTRRLNARPFLRWSLEKHFSAEAHAIIENSRNPDYETMEFYADARIDF